MKSIRPLYSLIVSAVLLMTGVSELSAQRFSVSSFKALPNDVSAFIDPVRDLNDEDCGLVKVMASDDFAFSTPLGIVKRVDKVGEIWLYLPRGSKKITIKHPEWGVLRDYLFPTRIDSHMSYEMRIDEPVRPGNNAEISPIVSTVRDTLVLTRVDTLIIRPVKKYIPLDFDALATVNYGGKTKSVMAGVLLMALKRHGGFVHVSTDFGKIGSVVAECDKNGEIDDATPFYTGQTRQSAFMINAGAAHRLSACLTVFEGVGYSSTGLAWQLAPSEGGGYVRNSYYTSKGISFEAGMAFKYKRLVILASVISIKGSDWFGSVGIGIRLGK